MKDIWEGVMWVAEIIRSASFSRWGESRTTRKEPEEKDWMQVGRGSKRVGS